ncbi:ycf20-like protein isoform X2 [Mangifera indica]|uniref:ycf20-like protein isoform X2 n=1 Tax=Mangifera indica TaxID=29780 RepID=UPI001CFA644A|nr:ycf20-like protein isoform X2 [Mangifera indica]
MTMINTLPKNPRSWKLSFPESKYVRSRADFFFLAACSHRTKCALSSKYYSRSCFIHVAQPFSVSNNKKMAWSIRSSVDGSGFDPSSTDSPNGGTRLIRTIQAFQTKLSARIQEIRKGLPMKLLFFLVGFYCATAFATVIGQTGDWDILSAALAVVVVEAIGALMYRASLPLVSKLKGLITMFNYWKAGLSLGLFLDSFKYEMDNIIESSNPFNFEIDMFTIFS